MATNVVMPQMGESIAEGTIVRWIKKVGDSVDRDEPLFEISTDKVDAEIPSPSAGVLTEIKVKEGETVPVNSVVATIGAAGEAAAKAPSTAAIVPATPVTGFPRLRSASPRPARALKAARPPSERRRPRRGRPPRRRLPARPERLSKEELRRQKSSPLVRRIAKEHDVDIQQIQGTGISGRVTKGDILGSSSRAARRRQAPAQARTPGGRSRVPSRRKRPDRADERHAAEDRRTHGAQRAHVSARVLGLRGELRPRQRAAREAQGRSTKRPARSLTFTAFIAKAVVDASAPVPDRQRFGGRRQHRLQEGHQSRDRRGAREWV